MKNIVLIMVFFCATIAQGQTFVITNTTVFDGENILENTSVLVEDGIVKEIAPSIVTKVTPVDGSGKFLMPAMTNSHVHAFMAPNLMEAAKAGVLNVLDMHGMEQFQKGMQETSFKNDGMARYYFAGAAATAPDGHGTQFGFPSPTLTTEDEAEAFVDARLAVGASYLKIIEEPWKPTLSHSVVKSLIDAAHTKNTLAVVHISKAEDAFKVLENDADGLVHIWWDKVMSDEQFKTIAQKDNFIIPTVLTSHLFLDNMRSTAPEGSFLSNAEISSEVKRAYDAGIPILAGTDPPNANINYGTDLYRELDLLSKAGIPNIDVLKSATSLPAKHFKLENTGYIKEGFNADFILLNKNPINDIQHISAIDTVWKNGKVVER